MWIKQLPCTQSFIEILPSSTAICDSLFPFNFTAPPNLHTQPPDSWALPASRRTVTSRGWMHFPTPGTCHGIFRYFFILGRRLEVTFCAGKQVAESEVFFVFETFFFKVATLLEPTSCWIAVGSVHPHGNCFSRKISVAETSRFKTSSFNPPSVSWNLQGISFNRSLTYFLPWIDRTFQRVDFQKRCGFWRWALWTGVMMDLFDGWRKVSQGFCSMFFSKSDAERAIYECTSSQCDCFFAQICIGITIMILRTKQVERRWKKTAPKL